MQVAQDADEQREHVVPDMHQGQVEQLASQALHAVPSQYCSALHVTRWLGSVKSPE